MTILCPSIEVSEVYKLPKDFRVTGLKTNKELEEILLVLSKLGHKLIPEKYLEKGSYEINGVLVDLPLTARRLKNDHIVLMLNSSKVDIVGKGGESTVKKIYNLSEGVFHAKKTCNKKIQKQVYEKLHCKEGLISYIDFFENKWDELRVVEPLYQTDLFDYLENYTLTTKQKMQLFTQLLKGLVEIHKTPHTFKYMGNQFKGFLSHNDIKLENILVNITPDDDLIAVLTDYGATGRWDRICHTINFESPELIAFFNKDEYDDVLAKISFNIDYGQLRDVWSLGIVFSTALLLGPPKDAGIEGVAVMKFMQFLMRNQPSDEVFLRLQDISQEVIDTEIESIKSSILISYPEEEAKILINLWSIVNRMLTLESAKRISAYTALSLIDPPEHPLSSSPSDAS